MAPPPSLAIPSPPQPRPIFFTGKISAWTSGNDQNKTILDDETEMVLYDSKVPGTEIKLESGGSISLSRRIVAVPLNEDLCSKFLFGRTVNLSTVSLF
jgi:hypothetical protein